METLIHILSFTALTPFLCKLQRSLGFFWKYKRKTTSIEIIQFKKVFSIFVLYGSSLKVNL